jgi:hypothetical protein
MINPMRRSRWVVGALLSVVGAAGVAGCATTGPSGNEIRPRPNLTAADYYPLTPGWKWAYDVEHEGQSVLATYAVVDRTGDVATVQAGDDRLTYAVSAQGISQADAGISGDFVIKNPIAQGAEWPVTGGQARIVSVNADFKLDSGEHYLGCIVVEVTRTEPVRIARTTFAPDLGPVALEMQVQDGPKFVTTTRARLRAVTRPTDKF